MRAPAGDAARLSEEGPLDLKALEVIRGLQREGQPDLLDKVIGLYLRDAPGLLAAMRDAALKGDAEALRRAAHSLKSSSANVGAVRLCDACKALELAARAGELDQVDPQLAVIASDFAQARIALEALLQPASV